MPYGDGFMTLGTGESSIHPSSSPGDTAVRPRLVLEQPAIARPRAPAARLDTRQRPKEVSVIVIGAGIAGLVAAYHLKRRGIRVAVLEAAEHAGGRARSDVVTVGQHRFVVHHGAQMSSPAYEELRPLMEELGLSGSVVENSPFSSILTGGQLVQVDRRDIFSAKDTILTSQEWWDCGHRALLDWCRWLRGRSVSDPGHWLDLDDATADRLAAGLGRGTARVMNGLVHAFEFQRPETVTRALTLSLLVPFIDGLLPESLRDGFGTLVDRLVEEIGDVRLGQAVTNVETTPRGVKVSVGADELSADDVVIATTADVARRIYPAASAAEQRLLAVDYVPTFNVVLDVGADWSRHPRLAGTYGIQVPAHEMGPGDVIAAISLESGRTRRPTPGHEKVQMMLDAERARALLGADPARILERAVAEADRKGLLPGVSRAPRTYQAVFEIRAAFPETPPGRFAVLRAYERSLLPTSRVKFAGDFRGFPRLGSAAFSGVVAARETTSARRARAGAATEPISPPRPGRQSSTARQDLSGALSAYCAAVGWWGESLSRGDLWGGQRAWAGGWRSFFQGLESLSRVVGPDARRR
jgi:protoporphyrinogen/coproporphyrinogen III oxidase